MTYQNRNRYPYNAMKYIDGELKKWNRVGLFSVMGIHNIIHENTTDSRSVPFILERKLKTCFPNLLSKFYNKNKFLSFFLSYS
jgi:hypothetical protein